MMVGNILRIFCRLFLETDDLLTPRNPKISMKISLGPGRWTWKTKNPPWMMNACGFLLERCLNPKIFQGGKNQSYNKSGLGDHKPPKITEKISAASHHIPLGEKKAPSRSAELTPWPWMSLGTPVPWRFDVPMVAASWPKAGVEQPIFWFNFLWLKITLGVS